MSDMKVPSIRILVVISTPKLIDTAIYLFQEGSIPIQYQTNAIGTASNEIMDALGLGSTEKSVLISLMPKAFADQMLLMLKKEMQLHTPNSGVAFTLAMTGSNNHMLRMPSTLNEYETNLPIRSETMNKNDIKYTLIAAVVNQGYSEEVMQAAGSAGADGGTVLHSRRRWCFLC